MDAYGRTVVQSLPYEHSHFQIWNEDGSVVMDYAQEGQKRLTLPDAQRAFMRPGPSSATQALLSGDDGMDLRSPVDSQFRKALLGLLGLAAVVFAAAGLLVEFSVRRQAMRSIRAIARMDAGNYSELIGPSYARGELGDVMRALDQALLHLRNGSAEGS
eukprot:gene6326-6188_t